MTHYLLFVAHSYAFSILRPLQAEIRRRGGEVAWWVEWGCPNLLRSGERQLRTLAEVRKWNPRACFVPGNWIYDFFPGVKVSLFHGFPINKRGDKRDDHFTIRGWFDVYCAQGPSSTPVFRRLAEQHGCFRVYETGWPKTDSYVRCRAEAACRKPVEGRKPTILVGSTFSKGISALAELYPYIQRMADTKPWNWLVTMHPKLYENTELRRRYEQLAASRPNVRFVPIVEDVSEMADTDVLLCDSSSIIVEYMLLGKPVVTLRNTCPGPHLINVLSPALVEQALEQALHPSPQLLSAEEAYVATMEAHRDGRNSERVLDAVDDFIGQYWHKLPRRRRPTPFRWLKVRCHFLRNAMKRR